MCVPENENPYAAPQSSGKSPRPVRLGTPPPITGAANLAIWLFLLPMFLAMIVTTLMVLIR